MVGIQNKPHSRVLPLEEDLDTSLLDVGQVKPFELPYEKAFSRKWPVLLESFEGIPVASADILDYHILNNLTIGSYKIRKVLSDSERTDVTKFREQGLEYWMDYL